jgi:LPS sulfotransferase NodH
MNIYQFHITLYRQIKRTLFGPFSKLRKYNICMWHAGRCGSTVIADLIRQDGRIDWGGEILEGDPKKMFKKGYEKDYALNIINKKINKRQKLSGLKPFGFEMKLWHYERIELPFSDVLRLLQDIGFNRHIILERKNYLRIGASAKVAKATGNFHYKTGEKRKHKKVYFDVSNKNLMDGIKIHEDFYNQLKSELPAGHLYLCYEDDIEV